MILSHHTTVIISTQHRPPPHYKAQRITSWTSSQTTAVSLPSSPNDIPEVILRATKPIVEGDEAFISNGGAYWAKKHHTLALRKRVAIRYPGHELHITTAAGEGDWDHTESITACIKPGYFL